MPSDNNCKPILRWAGSKRQILDTLSKYWRENHTKYVEPFCGSASLFAKLGPASAQLSDTNVDLIEMYGTVSRSPTRVYNEVLKWKSDRETFTSVRSFDPRTLCDTKRAARFIYLNRHCFNGLYRTNQKGEFNVPWGAKGAGALPSLEKYKAFAKQLGRAKLIACDFGEALRRIREGAFVYLDPPYCVSERRIFREYGAMGFSSEDIKRLRSALVSLESRGIDFVLSYADSDEARYLGKGFLVRELTVRRFISGSSESRAKAKELLITNIGAKKR